MTTLADETQSGHNAFQALTCSIFSLNYTRTNCTTSTPCDKQIISALEIKISKNFVV